jgi:hypothetical protein
MTHGLGDPLAILDSAIRAAQIADQHFVLTRRPAVALQALKFALEVSSTPPGLHIFVSGQIAPRPAIASWDALKPDERSAWAIFHATARILHAAAREEMAKAASKPFRMPVPRWMYEDEDRMVPSMSDRTYPVPRAAAPPPPVDDEHEEKPKRRAGKKG